jgi:uncharacterized membrane protein YedE/YeeE
MKHLSSFFAGLLFSLGLMVSGMINPAKVLAFLDIAGAWDPSLAFVMGGAVITTFLGYKFVLKRDTPVFDDEFHIPERTDIDRKLLVGASLFGIGWGLVGICPGPGLVVFAAAPTTVVAFITAMIAGMLAHRFSSTK